MGVLLFWLVQWLLRPSGLRGAEVVLLIPLCLIPELLFGVSVADVIVLARRPDTNLPWRVGGSHVLLAILLAFVPGGSWVSALVLFGIGATQMIAIWLFQMTPSQASSQR